MKNDVFLRIYKLCRFFSWLIAFFIGGIFYSMTCHAQAMPSLSVDSFSLIQGGAQDLFNVGFIPNGLMPSNNSAFPNSNFTIAAWDVGYTTLTSFDDDDIEITELPTEYKDALLELGALYDSNGVPLTSADHIYIGNVDNGFFSGSFYIDSTGTILGDNSTLSRRLFNMRYGGYIKDTVDWIQMYDDISAEIFTNSYILPFDANFDITDRSFYLWYGYSAGQNRSEAYIFVPDIYNPGVSVTNGYTNGRSPAYIYFNDNSGIVYETILSSTSPYVGTPYRVENGSFSLNGYTYSHRLSISWVITSYSNSDHNAFMNSGAVSPQQAWNFNANQFIWNPSLLENSNFAAFKQLQFEDSSTKILNFDDTFDYNQLQELIESLNNLQPSVNNEFDYSQPITENNYYNYTYITENHNLPNSTLPLPGGNTSPLPNNDPFLQYNEANQPSSEDVQSSINNFGIPFFQNLQYKYPFSIPWDIKNFISSFKAEPTPPAWDFDWNITVGNTTYTHHFQGDLSEFNSLAAIFRNLLLISFIIGLCVFSYKSHF